LVLACVADDGQIPQLCASGLDEFKVDRCDGPQLTHVRSPAQATELAAAS